MDRLAGVVMLLEQRHRAAVAVGGVLVEGERPRVDPLLARRRGLAGVAHEVAIGVVALLNGLLPRAIRLAWIVVLYSFFVVYLGGLLRVPDWMVNLSPFGHVARVPAESFRVAPLLLLTVVAAGLVTAGLAGLRGRDLQSPA